MPVLDIGFSQAKMASIAPKMAATLAVKRSSLALINGDDAEARTMHLAQQSLKKRRLLPLPSTTSPTHSSQTVAHDGPPSPRSSETDDSGDLTNLNWLQDANLLKNFLSDPLDAGKSNGSSSADTELESAPAGSGEQVIAIRRPPKSVHRKPPYSYSALIFMAIESSPTKSMLVREIYSWITTNFPYFETAPSGWKNTIRHTLSLRKCFKKIDKGYAASEQSGDNDSDSGDVKGGYWHVDRDYRPGLQQLVERSRQSILPKVVVRKGVWDCLWSSGPAKLDSSSQSSLSETPKLVALSGQRFIKVPVIRSFSRHRTKPQAQGTGKVAAPMWAPKATWEKAAEAYQLELTLNKLCSGLSNGRAMPTAVPSQRRNRNSVSVISVNQAPKVYAPVPKVTGGKHSPVLPQLNHTLASTHPAHLIRNGPFAKVHLATDRQQHKVSTFPNAHCPHIVSTGRVTSNGTVTAANGHRVMVQANLASIKSENEDDDDVLIRDGAQALLNFASGAFQLNRLIKQED